MTTTESNRGRRTRRAVATVTVALLMAAAVAVGYAVFARPRSAEQVPAALPTSVATVARGTATERLQVSGTLEYEGSYSVVHQGPAGILTSAAPPGSSIEAGGVLYTVANQPVRLLVGAIPAYREFAAGMADGPDVAQLEQSLVALGMDPRHRITVDNHFNAATRAAICHWQTSWGLPAGQRTGRLALGQVAFLPTTLRASQLLAPIGASVGADTVVLTATSTKRVVTAQIPADRQATVQVGDQVIVSMSGAGQAPGTVAGIGQAPAPGEQAQGNAVTVPATVGVDLPADSPELSQTPVRVAITTASHPDVLLVPVTALLARPGGGYQVRMASGEYWPVEPGLFDDAAGAVEVGGSNLDVGQLVQVPAP